MQEMVLVEITFAVDALLIGRELVFVDRGAYRLKVALQRTVRDDGWL